MLSTFSRSFFPSLLSLPSLTQRHLSSAPPFTHFPDLLLSTPLGCCMSSPSPHSLLALFPLCFPPLTWTPHLTSSPLFSALPHPQPPPPQTRKVKERKKGEQGENRNEGVETDWHTRKNKSIWGFCIHFSELLLNHYSGQWRWDTFSNHTLKITWKYH